MVLAGKTFWNLPRIAATNRWCLAWKDGLQPRIPEIAGTHHLAVATWHKCLLLTALAEIKDFKAMTVETEETEEITEIAPIKEIGIPPMVAELTSTRMPEEVGVAKEARPEILLVFLLLLLANSPLLT